MKNADQAFKGAVVVVGFGLILFGTGFALGEAYVRAEKGQPKIETGGQDELVPRRTH